jgi:hypothetical protein
MVNVFAKKDLVDHVVTSVWMVFMTFQIAIHANVPKKDQVQIFAMSKMANVHANTTMVDVSALNVPLAISIIQSVKLVIATPLDLLELHALMMANVTAKQISQETNVVVVYQTDLIFPNVNLAIVIPRVSLTIFSQWEAAQILKRIRKYSVLAKKM